MIGPKKAPTRAVPRDCIANSANKIPAAITSVQGLNPLSTYCSPSVADSTDIAGVIIESP